MQISYVVYGIRRNQLSPWNCLDITIFISITTNINIYGRTAFSSRAIGVVGGNETGDLSMLHYKRYVYFTSYQY